MKWYMDVKNIWLGFILFGSTMSITVFCIYKWSKVPLKSPDEWITVDGWYFFPILALAMLLLSWFMDE